MRKSVKIFVAAFAALAPFSQSNPLRAEEACGAADGGLPISRVIAIDATSGPIFGAETKQAKEENFLRPKEVVLTFDDGPMPWITKSILDTLDHFCTKATFFSVGNMALAYPAVPKEVLARGHTLGSHTFSHPYNLPRMDISKAKSEIERGIAAVSAAAGGPIAPFFRFPGLADSSALLTYLASRHIASFSVDVISNDSYIHDKQRLIDRTIAEVEKRQGGIILFHDIKLTTAKALPEILTKLKAKGYSVVQMKSATPVEPDAAILQEFNLKLAKVKGSEKAVVATNVHIDVSSSAEITTISPPIRDRSHREPVRQAGSQQVSSLTKDKRKGPLTYGWSGRSNTTRGTPSTSSRQKQEPASWFTQISPF